MPGIFLAELFSAIKKVMCLVLLKILMGSVAVPMKLIVPPVAPHALDVFCVNSLWLGKFWRKVSAMRMDLAASVLYRSLIVCPLMFASRSFLRLSLFLINPENELACVFTVFIAIPDRAQKIENSMLNRDWTQGGVLVVSFTEYPVC